MKRKHTRTEATDDRLTPYLQDAQNLVQALADSAGIKDLAWIRGLYCIFAVHALTLAPVSTADERTKTLEALRALFPAAMKTQVPQSRPGILGRLFHRK